MYTNRLARVCQADLCKRSLLTAAGMCQERYSLLLNGNIHLKKIGRFLGV